mmetsp:Transcript_20656/g.39213  ORF Transcript_20656/g.39213 Transcript_20656/m.39213 type:complete len:875 (+) Transcript_20656:71-2695(+)
MASSKDIEEAHTESETEPLLKEDVLQKLHNRHVIGPEMGNPRFWKAMQLAVRTAICGSTMGLLVWDGDRIDRWTGFGKYADYMPSAICILIYTIDLNFGTVLKNALAIIIGVFWATLNIVVLRGFFPDGVEPGMGTFAKERVAGWVNLTGFNLIFLVVDVQNKTRIFAIAQNMFAILAFLNPDNTIVFSKNFHLDSTGNAVRSFIGFSVGAVFAILMMLIPYPFGVAYTTMRSNASKTSADMARMFILAVKYCSGSQKTVRIEQHFRQLEKVRAEIDGMEAGINAAYEERFDIGSAGIVRGFMIKHSELMEELYDILHALLMALETEAFGPNHMMIVQDIGIALAALVDETALLLVAVTDASNQSHMKLTDEEEDELIQREDAVKLAVLKLSSDFDEVRRKFPSPLCLELLSASSIVFALSAYGRHVREYSEMLRNRPPRGLSLLTSFNSYWKAKCSQAFEYPTMRGMRFVVRYMVGLTAVLVFAVTRDGYSPACAMTAAYLLNVEPSPNIKGSFDIVLAIVTSSIFGSLLFSWSCQTIGTTALPFVFGIFMSVSIHIAKSGSSFAHIGFWAAALAPFNFVQQCPAAIDARSASTAQNLWANVRARLLAMCILTFCEFACMETKHSSLATKWYETAMSSIQAGLTNIIEAKDPRPAMKGVPTSLALAAQFSKGAELEPRLNACEWQAGFLAECIDAVAKIRTDILLCYRAFQGQEDDFKLLRDVPAFKNLEDDLINTFEETKVMSRQLLLHRTGIFRVLTDDKGGICHSQTVDKLQGLDEAMDDVVRQLSAKSMSKVETGQEFLLRKLSQDTLMDPSKINTVMTYLIRRGTDTTSKAPASMEDDQLCKVSLQITMLEFMKRHVSSIVHSAIKHV